MRSAADRFAPRPRPTCLKQTRRAVRFVATERETNAYQHDQPPERPPVPTSEQSHADSIDPDYFGRYLRLRRMQRVQQRSFDVDICGDLATRWPSGIWACGKLVDDSPGDASGTDATPGSVGGCRNCRCKCGGLFGRQWRRTFGGRKRRSLLGPAWTRRHARRGRKRAQTARTSRRAG
jgi:hypothetical protein